MPKANGTRSQFSCPICGKIIFRMHSRVMLNPNAKRFCSAQCMGLANRADPVDLFLSHVEKTDSCWLWTGHIQGGYGMHQFTVAANQRKYVMAHRYSWELHNGPIADGMFVLHDCPGGDNRRCVNPDHLYLGDHAQNMLDKITKGTAVKGEAIEQAKLNEEKVRQIRSRFASGGCTKASLATEFGVSAGTIRWIIQRRAWKHVK